MVAVHDPVRNQPLPDRIWLITEQADDDAAEILRSAGAEVIEASPEHRAPDARGAGAHSLVVIASPNTGRALVESVGRSSSHRFERPAVVICEQARPLDLRALLGSGVGGVVLREHMSRTLVPTVAAVASGQVCLPGREVVAARRPVLSMREKQVMGLVAMGLMNVEIGDRLFLAESTVKSHLSSAFAKLGVRSRHEAVEVLLNPVSGLGLGILSLDEEAIPTDAHVADLQ